MGRTLTIGDIHGCVHALDAVLTAARPGFDDTVVVLGDVIDYGRESAAVIERLMQLRSECELVCIQGNHEEMLLGALDNEELKSQWLNVGGMEMLNSYQFCGDIDVIPKSHLDFLREFRDYFETDTHIFTHANYDPELPFDEQPTYTLRWQLLEPPWPDPHCSGKTVVVGHTELRDGEMLDLGHVVGIDTACRSYGWLTLWEPETGRYCQASKWGALHALEDREEIHQLKHAREILHGSPD